MGTMFFKAGLRKRLPELRERTKELAAASTEMTMGCGAAFAPYAAGYLAKARAGYLDSLVRKYLLPANDVFVPPGGAAAAVGSAAAAPATLTSATAGVPTLPSSRFAAIFDPLDVAAAMADAAEELERLLRDMRKPDCVADY